MKFTKRFLILPVALLLAVLLLAGCSGAKKITKNFELSESAVTLMAGETKLLILNDLQEENVGDYSVTWVSGDEGVATVSEDGLVTAIAEGSATVSAVVKVKKTEVKFSCDVTVTKNTTPLSAISFSSSIYALGQGQTVDLKNEVICHPANAARPIMTWESSNTNIATVTDGIVVPVSEGITTVTVTAGALTASCTIRVSEMVIDPTGITLDYEVVSMAAGTSVVLLATVEPADATGYSILWTSSDPTVATVAGGKVTAVREGSATVTAKLNVGGGKMYAECQIEVSNETTLGVPAERVQISPSSMNVESGTSAKYKFDTIVTPHNYTDRPYWYTNRGEVIDINPDTGEFTVKAVTDDVSVLVTCEIGNVSATAVVNVRPAKPKLEIIVNEEDVGAGAGKIYNKAPLNILPLIAVLSTSNDLPDVTWKVSDPTIAEIDVNGVVTAKKAGTCTVSAILNSDNTIGATYELTVEKAPFLSVKVGETIAIDPTLIPSDPTNWYYATNNSHFTINTADKTITGVTVTEGAPQIFSCNSQSTAKPYSVEVYVLPND